jgi:hypothetical protein
MGRSTTDLLPIKPGFPWNLTILAANTTDEDADPVFPSGATYRMAFKQLDELLFELDTTDGLTVVADPNSLEIEISSARSALFRTDRALVYCDLVRTDGVAETHTWIELVLSVERSVTDAL